MATAKQPTNKPITVPTPGPDNRPDAQTNTMRSFTKPGCETAISSINPNTAKIHNAVPRSHPNRNKRLCQWRPGTRLSVTAAVTDTQTSFKTEFISSKLATLTGLYSPRQL